MYKKFNALLQNVFDEDECLKDVIGYYERFIDDNLSESLSCIGLIFEKQIINISVQEDDDSLKLFSGFEWKPNETLYAKSLITIEPWCFAKNKPIFGSWIFINQQGYFDGLQIDFAEDVEDDNNVVIQLVAICSELQLRKVSNELCEIKWKD